MVRPVHQHRAVPASLTIVKIQICIQFPLIVLMFQKRLIIAIPGGKNQRGKPAFIISLPPHFTIRRIGSPPNHGTINPKLLQDLRHGADMSKGIRKITKTAKTPVLFGRLHPNFQILDTGLRGTEELICQNIPRPHLYFPAAYQFFQPGKLLF